MQNIVYITLKLTVKAPQLHVTWTVKHETISLQQRVTQTSKVLQAKDEKCVCVFHMHDAHAALTGLVQSYTQSLQYFCSAFQ